MSFKASPTKDIGDTEIFTIRCINCDKKLFAIEHRLGDGLVHYISTDTFEMKALCAECETELQRMVTDFGKGLDEMVKRNQKILDEARMWTKL